MTFERLSRKQLKVLKWWIDESVAEKYDVLICDGAVRSGKTSIMILSFVLWAMDNFDNQAFGICGKTVRSAERNIILPLQQMADLTAEYRLEYTRSNNLLTVSGEKTKNYFYVFGGRDESSYMLIQGITLSGVFFDEVALMPESFVNQGIARTLSVTKRRLWFNCNPENPNHWFYKEWVLKADERGAKRLRFLMGDNPAMTERELERAKASYPAGAFYDRYILGEWVKAEGIIYPMFSSETHVVKKEQIPTGGEHIISVDYGTANPTAAILWRIVGGVAYAVKEYYHDGRKNGQLTDEEHRQNIENLVSDIRYRYAPMVIIDPSAASLITSFRRKGLFSIRGANNDVIDGIRNVASALANKMLIFSETCVNSIRELKNYVWDEKSVEERPLKEDDHCCDAIRYFVRTSFLRNHYDGLR